MTRGDIYQAIDTAAPGTSSLRRTGPMPPMRRHDAARSFAYGCIVAIAVGIVGMVLPRELADAITLLCWGAVAGAVAAAVILGNQP